jgi:hypothetical protein
MSFAEETVVAGADDDEGVPTFSLLLLPNS